MISFDDQRLTQAGRDLAETEKLCANETTTKFTRTTNSSDSKVKNSFSFFDHFCFIKLENFL